MSFSTIRQAPAQLNGSDIAIPGSRPRMFEKAVKSSADVVVVDLEAAAKTNAARIAAA